MTRQDRWIVDLHDIVSLRWQCGHCGASVAYPLDQLDHFLHFPRQCPGCRKLAVDPNMDPTHAALDGFVDALKVVLRFPREAKRPGAIKLEFNATPGS